MIVFLLYFALLFFAKGDQDCSLDDFDEELIGLRDSYLEDITQKTKRTSKWSSFVDDKAEDYARSVSIRESSVQTKLREFTKTFPNGEMISGPLVKSLMQMFIRLTNGKKCIDVGVYTGSSSLAMAIALPVDGVVHSLEYNPKIAKIAEKFWEMEKVENKIELMVGKASDSLDNLLQNDENIGTFDFAFIDADKVNYQVYYEKVLKLLRSNGVMLIDNTLWHGAVYDETNEESSTIAIRQLNEYIHSDERVDVVLIPFSDGITCVRKR